MEKNRLVVREYFAITKLSLQGVLFGTQGSIVPICHVYAADIGVSRGTVVLLGVSHQHEAIEAC